MTNTEAAQLCQSIKFMVDNEYYSEEVEEALNMAKEALLQEPIIPCKNCKHWKGWENGTGFCHRSENGCFWFGTDADDFCSFAEPKGSDEE